MLGNLEFEKSKEINPATSGSQNSKILYSIVIDNASTGEYPDCSRIYTIDNSTAPSPRKNGETTIMITPMMYAEAAAANDAGAPKASIAT